jgi:hypothetical protein
MTTGSSTLCSERPEPGHAALAATDAGLCVDPRAASETPAPDPATPLGGVSSTGWFTMPTGSRCAAIRCAKVAESSRTCSFWRWTRARMRIVSGMPVVRSLSAGGAKLHTTGVNALVTLGDNRCSAPQRARLTSSPSIAATSTMGLRIRQRANSRLGKDASGTTLSRNLLK